MPPRNKRVSVIERKLQAKGKTAVKGDSAAELEDSQTLTQYAAFVPRKLLPQLPTMAAAAAATATCEEIHGVVSFLDLAGFTKLTERLALQSDGAERLAKIINKLMGQMLDTLKTGDTIKFSGDAICVLYEPDRSFMKKDAPSPVAGNSADKPGENKTTGVSYGGERYDDLPAMRDATYRAVSEGLEALFDDYTVPASELGDFGDPDDPAAKDGIHLALHVAVTAGRMQFTNVGGVFGRWEVLLAGPAMQALGPTADRAPTDWCTVHPECWELLQGLTGGNPFQGQHMGPGSGCTEYPGPEDQGFVRVLLEGGRVKTSSEALKATFSGSMSDYKYPKDSKQAALALKEWGATVDMAHHFLGREAVAKMHPATLAVLRRYVEPLIKQAISASALPAISCFTDVSVLFLGISEIDLGAKHPSEDHSLWGQLIMQTTQECVYDHEGAVNKFVMDDKGALMLCAWGLPPLSHADDPHRATSAALELAAALKALGAKARIGVTTGKVFAGVIGPSYRCEFSMLGDAVNLAARLMGKAPFGGVLCDEPTYSSAETSGSKFEVLEPVKVKGKELPIPIFRPLFGDEDDDNDDDGASSLAISPGQTKRKKSVRRVADNFASGASVLGTATHIRSAERAQLTGILGGFFSGQVGGGVLLLAGDAGSGKSELAKLVPKSAKEHDARLIESKTPKHKQAVAEVQTSPCLEMSQLLRALLTPDNTPDGVEGGGGEEMSRSKEGGKEKKKEAGGGAKKEGSTAVTGPPSTKEEWQERVALALAGRPELIGDSAKLFEGYYREWCGLPFDSSSSEKGSKDNAASPTSSSNSGEGGGEGEESSYGDSFEAVARREVLGAVLEACLIKQSLLLFVHVRTGSSLSANAVHPEMWPLLQWLSAFAAKRNHGPCAAGTHPLAVVFVNRRILDSGGKRQNEAVAAVVADAKECRGLLQLDPLDERDRYNYLCLSLKTAQAPPEVKQWVSDTANGNPQYTEICAKAIEKADLLTLVQPTGGGLATAELKEGGALLLSKLEAPPKIAGFIRSTLGSLGPEERLVTQLIALFPSDDKRLPPRPTKEVLRLSYETVAPMDEDRLTEVLERLVLYGIVMEKAADPHGGGGGDPSSSSSSSFELIWPLLKDIAATMLLKNQKEAILNRNARLQRMKSNPGLLSFVPGCSSFFSICSTSESQVKSSTGSKLVAAEERRAQLAPVPRTQDEEAAAAAAFFGPGVTKEWVVGVKKLLSGAPGEKHRFETALRAEYAPDELPSMFEENDAAATTPVPLDEAPQEEVLGTTI